MLIHLLGIDRHMSHHTSRQHSCVTSAAITADDVLHVGHAAQLSAVQHGN